MSTHVTEDGVEVTAAFFDVEDTLPDGVDATAPVWVIEYPDDVVKLCHPNAFDNEFTEIGA